MARDDRVRRARSGGPAEAANAVGERLEELLSGLAARKGVSHAVIAVESGDRLFR